MRSRAGEATGRPDEPCGYFSQCKSQDTSKTCCGLKSIGRYMSSTPDFVGQLLYLSGSWLMNTALYFLKLLSNAVNFGLPSRSVCQFRCEDRNTWIPMSSSPSKQNISIRLTEISRCTRNESFILLYVRSVLGKFTIVIRQVPMFSDGQLKDQLNEISRTAEILNAK